MTEQEVKAKLRDWIGKRARKSLSQPLADDTRVLDEGILSSLDIVEFVLFIESLRGDDIDIESIEPAVFNSVNSLHAAFFAKA